MSARTVVVTGSSGFLGRQLVPFLRDGGATVTTVGRSRADLGYDDLPAGLPPGDGSVVHLAGKAHDIRGTSDEAEYTAVNTDLTLRVFDAFLRSDLSTFVYLSSVKAVCDHADGPVTEETPCHPVTAYGRSKLAAERALWAAVPPGRRLLVLRPVMIHGPGNKGNLTLLHRAVSRGLPYPLGAFENARSLVSSANACFLIDRLLTSEVSSGTFTLSDDESVSTVEIVRIMADELGRRPRILRPSIATVRRVVGALERVPAFPLTQERLDKLTESFVAPNAAVRTALGIDRLPLSVEEGLRRTVRSFARDDRS